MFRLTQLYYKNNILYGFNIFLKIILSKLIGNIKIIYEQFIFKV